MSQFLLMPSMQHKQKIEFEAMEIQQIEAAKVDIAAFEVIYQRYVERIYRYVHVRVNNDEDAADMTQQIFLNVLHALPRYQSRGIPFAAWLFRIAQYTVINKLRRDKGTVSWDLLPEEISLSFEEDPERLLLRQEDLGQLRQRLNKLDRYKRELLALRFAADLNAAEIAVVVGKSQDAVRKQLSRILHTLKEDYSDAEG